MAAEMLVLMCDEGWKLENDRITETAVGEHETIRREICLGKRSKSSNLKIGVHDIDAIDIFSYGYGPLMIW